MRTDVYLARLSAELLRREVEPSLDELPYCVFIIGPTPRVAQIHDALEPVLLAAGLPVPQDGVTSSRLLGGVSGAAALGWYDVPSDFHIEYIFSVITALRRDIRRRPAVMAARRRFLEALEVEKESLKVRASRGL